MKPVFKHIEKYHRTIETLAMKECGQGLYVGVHSITELPYNECDEHTTSIVLPLSEIPELIKSLTALLDSE